MIKIEKLTKKYNLGDNEIIALNSIDLEIKDDEFVVIIGPSGSGKSTLLNLIGGMDKSTSGKIYIDGIDITLMSENEMEEYRRNDIGFVFQFYNLIPSLSVTENVSIVSDIVNQPLDVEEIIDSVGLSKRKKLFPCNLSGGELQRLSIARAIVKKPKILLCDEPTGALDSTTGVSVLSLLKDTARKHKITLIIVTHNSKLKDIADKVITLKDGKIDNIISNKHPINIEEVDW